MLLAACGAYALTMLSIDPFISSFMAICLSDTLFTSNFLLISFSLTTILIPFIFPLAALLNSLQPPPIVLALFPFHFVSCRHSKSTFLRSIMSACSFYLPVIVPTFKVPTLILFVSPSAVPAACSIVLLPSFSSCFPKSSSNKVSTCFLPSDT